MVTAMIAFFGVKKLHILLRRKQADVSGLICNDSRFAL